MERYPDGLALEQRFDAEVREFVKGATGVPCDDVAAAILLRDAGKMAALAMLQSNVIEVVGEVSLDELCDGGDTVESLVFRVV